MAEAIPGATGPRLNAALSTWPDWLDAPITRPQPEARLPSSSNEVYRVCAGEAQYVVRLNQPAPIAGANHGLERSLLEQLAGAGFMPKMVFADASCLVTRFIAGQSLGRHHQDIADLGRLFRTIHETSVNIDVRLDTAAHIADYADALQHQDARLQACIDWVAAAAYKPPTNLALCHHDLLPPNVIRTTAGLVALDWEYACLGDPAFDLAVVIEAENLSPAEVEALLTAYGDTSAHFSRRIDAMRPRYALISLLWWQLRRPMDANFEAAITALTRRLGLPL